MKAKVVKKLSLVIILVSISFMYGVVSHDMDIFPSTYAEKIFEEVYFEYEEYSEIRRYEKRTSLYELEAVYKDLVTLEGSIEEPYGAIDDLYSGIFLVSNVGDMFYIDEDKEISKLETSLSFSRDEFDQVARSKNLTRKWFGVKDILVREQSSSVFQVFVSSHHWDAEEQCYTLQFEMVVLERKGVADFALQRDWDKLYETSPCLPLKEGGANTFAGHQAGGRIQAQSDRKLFLTVGDHEFDGYNGDSQVVTDTTTSYGKVISLDLRTGESSVVSTGHRNPQGLYIDPEGRIWSTEHGPEGGDELNLIESGKNYGWPHVSYGTHYGMYTWPPSDTSGAHVDYRRPIYAWVPSIAVSELTGVEADLFDRWKGDLLVASLKKGTLYRIRTHEGRVTYVEPIELDHRLRDIVEMENGSIALKTDEGGVLTLRPAKQQNIES